MLNTIQLKQNKVTVRVWTSGFNLNDRGESIGHISLELPSYKVYLSLWPKQATLPDELSAKDSEGLGIFTPITHELLPDYKVDLNYEGRPPEIIINLYSLNCQSIVEKFNEFKKTLKGWALLGSLGGLVCKDGESCASMAWALLEAGGINTLISSTDQFSVSSQGSSFGSFFSSKKSIQASGFGLSSKSNDSAHASDNSSQGSSYSIEMGLSIVVKSPDALGELLKKAKRNELEKDPRTQQLKSDEEEYDIQQTEGRNCVLI